MPVRCRPWTTGRTARASRAPSRRVTRFRAALAARGGTGEVVVLPDSVHTAALAAQALGCEVGAIANSLLFAVRAAGARGRHPLLLLTSGAHRVDTEAVAARIGVPRPAARPARLRAHGTPGR